MNKALVFAAIAVVAISKVFVLKSVLVDLSAYQRCVSDGSVSLAKSCGTDPFGLKMPATTSISR